MPQTIIREGEARNITWWEQYVGSLKGQYGVSSSFSLQAIEEITSQHRSPNLEDLPRFHGGYVGFFAYESSQYAEAKIAMLPGKGSKFAEHMPDVMLVKAEKLIVFDNLDNSTQIIF